MVADGTNAGAVVIFTINFLLRASLSQLFTMIQALQIIILLPLMN